MDIFTQLLSIKDEAARLGARAAHINIDNSTPLVGDILSQLWADLLLADTLNERGLNEITQEQFATLGFKLTADWEGYEYYEVPSFYIPFLSSEVLIFKNEEGENYPSFDNPMVKCQVMGDAANLTRMMSGLYIRAPLNRHAPCNAANILTDWRRSRQQELEQARDHFADMILVAACEQVEDYFGGRLITINHDNNLLIYTRISPFENHEEAIVPLTYSFDNGGALKSIRIEYFIGEPITIGDNGISEAYELYNVARSIDRLYANLKIGKVRSSGQ